MAQRHGLGHKLLADAKRPRRFVPHAAGGPHGAVRTQEGVGVEQRRRIKAGELGGVPVRHGGEQQERRDEDEAGAA